MLPVATPLRQTLCSALRYNTNVPRAWTTLSSHRNFSSTVRKMAETKGGVHNLANKDEFKQALSQPGLMVLDCFATWCGPCKVIAPTVVKFSQQFTDARFYKIDVDEVPDVASELSIHSMPTFVFFKDGERVGEVIGANPKGLEAGIAKFA